MDSPPAPPVPLLRRCGAVIAASAVCAAAAAADLTLFTERHYAFDEEVQERFRERTGIRVSVVKAGANELMTRLEEEGPNTSADLYMTADAGGLVRAQRAGLLQPALPGEVLARVPEALRGAEGHWTAVSRRVRVLVYAKDRVRPEELSTYEDLADPKWRGRLLVRSSQNLYNQSLLASLIAAGGEEAAQSWTAAVRRNMARPPLGSDRDQVRAVANGIGDVAIVNTYYLGLMENSEDPRDREAAAAVEIFFPNQEGRGAHVNISGIGVVQASRQAERAVQFIEFLLSDEVQSALPVATYEYPAVEGAPWSEIQRRWGEFKADPLPMAALGEWNAKAVRIFNRAGWE